MEVSQLVGAVERAPLAVARGEQGRGRLLDPSHCVAG